MREIRYIHKLSGKWSTDRIGNKAQSLLFLQKKSFPVPLTWIVTSDAHQKFMQEGLPFMDRLRAELSGLPDLTFAIRSSTDLEDAEKLSYAGQFRTELHVRGKDGILQSIINIWESSGKDKVDVYPEEKNEMTGEIRFAIIIQEMVVPVLSGVGFSRNPVSNLNETIVEAVEGTGEDLLQKGITPMRWRIRGEKLLEGDSLNPFFPVIRKVISAIRVLKKKCRKDIDIEWAFNGDKLCFLQLRSVTGSPVQHIYSSRMVREMLPGLIKPLVWSVNIPLVNGIWIGIIEEITGKLDVRPEDLARSFHYRAYLNLAALGELFGKIGFSAENLEAVMTDEKEGMAGFRPGMKSIRYIPGLIRFLISRFGFERLYLRRYEALRKEFEILRGRITSEFSVCNYRGLYDSLFQTAGEVVYLNIFIPLLMRYYDKKLRRKLKSLQIGYEKLDFNHDFPLLSTFSPNPEMEMLRKELDHIPPGILNDCETLEALRTRKEATSFLELFELFLKKFGHFSESGTDFSVEKWEENPEFIFQLIRKLPVQPVREGLKTFDALRIPWYRRRVLRKLYRKTGRFRVYREQTSSLYIYGYGLFRSLFLQMGDELVKAGILEHRNDILYLYRAEIEKILEKGTEIPQPEYSRIVVHRKREMEETRDLILPSVIIGEDAPDLDIQNKKGFRGLGTSPGKFTGKVRVLSGISDFQKIVKGDVLVIPFSDVSWTPVLVQAGAIISEAGGMLSHCSIIAREMSIPAIVSVDHARSLEDGMRVTVDGSNGIITIYDNN